MARLLAGALRGRTKPENCVKRSISVMVRSTGKSGPVIGNMKGSQHGKGSAGNGPLRKHETKMWAERTV